MKPIGYSVSLGPVSMVGIAPGLYQRQLVVVDEPSVPDQLVLGEVSSVVGGFVSVNMHGLSDGGGRNPFRFVRPESLVPATLRDLTSACCEKFERSGYHLDLPYRIGSSGELIACGKWPSE